MEFSIYLKNIIICIDICSSIFQLIPGALLIDTEGQLIGMAIDGMQDARKYGNNYK